MSLLVSMYQSIMYKYEYGCEYEHVMCLHKCTEMCYLFYLQFIAACSVHHSVVPTLLRPRHSFTRASISIPIAPYSTLRVLIDKRTAIFYRMHFVSATHIKLAIGCSLARSVGRSVMTLRHFIVPYYSLQYTYQS